MLSFPTSFFDEEYYDDFYIEPMMKKAWAAELEVAAEFQHFCQKHQLTFWMDSGTLLGAVRHQGFIPWDDDMDFVMPREDYNRLLQIPTSEFPDHYCLTNAYNTPSSYSATSFFVNGLSINTTLDHLQKFHGFPYPAGIDICPLDILPDDDNVSQLLIKILKAIMVARTLSVSNTNHPDFETYLKFIESSCNNTLLRDTTLTNQLGQLFDIVSQSFSSSDGSITGVFEFAIPLAKNFVSRSCYNETVYLPFEQLKLPAPGNYHQVLTNLYTKDYMTPIHKNGSHDYPFYNKYRSVFEKLLKSDT